MASEQGRGQRQREAADTPNISPMPATPVNSVTSEPIAAAARPATATPAQPAPYRSRISSAWPRPGGEPEPHRQLLHQIEQRDKQQHERQQAIAPLRAGSGRR